MDAQDLRRPGGRLDCMSGVRRALLESVLALLDSEPEDIPGAAEEVRDAVHEYVKAMEQEEL